jgi:hypothetical protein
MTLPYSNPVAAVDSVAYSVVQVYNRVRREHQLAQSHILGAALEHLLQVFQVLG